MRFLIGYANTKRNGEDMALTPYLFLVKHTGTQVKVYGFGVCWFYYSAYLSLGFNVPDEVPTFINHDKIGPKSKKFD